MFNVTSSEIKIHRRKSKNKRDLQVYPSAEAGPNLNLSPYRAITRQYICTTLSTKESVYLQSVCVPVLMTKQPTADKPQNADSRIWIAGQHDRLYTHARAGPPKRPFRNRRWIDPSGERKALGSGPTSPARAAGLSRDGPSMAQ